MTSITSKLRRWFLPLAPAVKDARFWIAQAAVVAISVLHNVLEASPRLPTDLVDILPVSFFWIPLLYVSLRYGLAGSIVTSVVVVGGCLPNWIYAQRAGTLPQELFLVAIAVGVSLLVGGQSDRRLEARRDAEVYAAYAVRTQEEERKRLSLELHDDPVQTLISVCHELDALKNVPARGDALAGIRDSVEVVVGKLRGISAALRPPVLDDMGVVPAIRGLLEEINRNGKSIGALSVSGEQRRLPPDTEVALFRIAQEAVRNAASHAEAAHVRVALEFGVREVGLEVEDDGIGFDPAQSRAREGHLGLLSMKERAEMNGGRFELSSKLGHGTRVSAHLPIVPAWPLTLALPGQ